MTKRGWLARAIAAGLWIGLATGVAAADSFGGVSGNEKVYLVGRDKVCQPLVVRAAAARGMPACKPAPTAEVAALSVKTPAPERGSKAELSAAAKGRTLTVRDKDGAAVVAWDAPDPVASVVDVWRSKYGRLVMVEYTVRRTGREVHEVVGFELGAGGTEPVEPPTPTGPGPTTPTTPTTPTGPTTPTAPTGPAAKAEPALVKAVAKARKTRGQAAVAAWSKVLVLDEDHAEARYRLAAVHAQAKRGADAVAQLARLAASPRLDAIEWLVEARFDQAFARLVADPGFRTAVGLDRVGATAYERLMGFGGQWEQSLTPCERPEMKLAFARDRSFRLELKSACQGQRDSFRLKGTWAQRGDLIDLKLAGVAGAVDVAPCQFARDGSEDVLRCQVDEDLAFEGRPVRR